MFRVHDGRKKRKHLVAKFAANDPFVGVLLAAADFEWTCRRAIMAMGKGSTRSIRYELFDQEAFGLKLNKGWEKQVKQKAKGISKFEDIFSAWAPKNCSAYVIWADIEYAMMWRNKLIHGIENNISDAEGACCVNILECACDIIVEYLKGFKVDIYSYVGRGGKMSAVAEESRAEREARIKMNNVARMIMKDECVISGVRIKRDSVKEVLGISAVTLNRVSLQMSRKFGIKLLV